jgi:hypothetical protein
MTRSSIEKNWRWSTPVTSGLDVLVSVLAASRGADVQIKFPGFHSLQVAPQVQQLNAESRCSQGERLLLAASSSSSSYWHVSRQVVGVCIVLRQVLMKRTPYSRIMSRISREVAKQIPSTQSTHIRPWKHTGGDPRLPAGTDDIVFIQVC